MTFYVQRALRIIFPALHYQKALATTGCVPVHTRRMELCSKLFTKIKSPSLVFAILFHRLGRRRTAAPFATKTDHPL